MIVRNVGFKFCFCGVVFMMNSLVIIVIMIEMKIVVWVFKFEIIIFKGIFENI